MMPAYRNSHNLLLYTIVLPWIIMYNHDKDDFDKTLYHFRIALTNPEYTCILYEIHVSGGRLVWKNC